MALSNVTCVLLGVGVGVLAGGWLARQRMAGTAKPVRSFKRTRRKARDRIDRALERVLIVGGAPIGYGEFEKMRKRPGYKKLARARTHQLQIEAR